MSPTILHVEDEPCIRLLVGLLFQKILPQVTVQAVANGQQALDYLTGAGAYADRNRFPLPQLVLLDLDMPVLSGFEVLSWARARAEFKRLPIVALSSFALPEDFWSAKRLGATNCLRKTSRFEEVLDYARGFFAFWTASRDQKAAVTDLPGEPDGRKRFSVETPEELGCVALSH